MTVLIILIVIVLLFTGSICVLLLKKEKIEEKLTDNVSVIMDEVEEDEII